MNIYVPYLKQISHHWYQMENISNCFFADLKPARLRSWTVCWSADRGDEADGRLVLLLLILLRFIFTFSEMKVISQNVAAFCTPSALSHLL